MLYFFSQQKVLDQPTLQAKLDLVNKNLNLIKVEAVSKDLLIAKRLYDILATLEAVDYLVKIEQKYYLERNLCNPP